MQAYDSRMSWLHCSEWVCAMYAYTPVRVEVAPLRKALEAMKADLSVLRRDMNPMGSN
eukprot:SAG22_NODE_3672_length_1584_cov_1.603367_1_plen_58_part_00